MEDLLKQKTQETLATFSRRFLGSGRITLLLKQAQEDEESRPALLPWILAEYAPGASSRQSRSLNAEASKRHLQLPGIQENTNKRRDPIRTCCLSEVASRWEAAHLVPHCLSGGQFTWILASLHRCMERSNTDLLGPLALLHNSLAKLTSGISHANGVFVGTIFQTFDNDALPLSPELHAALDADEIWINAMKPSVSWLSGTCMPAALITRQEMGPRQGLKNATYARKKLDVLPALFAASAKTLFAVFASQRLKRAYIVRAGEVVQYRESHSRAVRSATPSSNKRPRRLPPQSSDESGPSSDPPTSDPVTSSDGPEGGPGPSGGAGGNSGSGSGGTGSSGGGSGGTGNSGGGSGEGACGMDKRHSRRGGGDDDDDVVMSDDRAPSLFDEDVRRLGSPASPPSSVMARSPSIKGGSSKRSVSSGSSAMSAATSAGSIASLAPIQEALPASSSRDDKSKMDAFEKYWVCRAGADPVDQATRRWVIKIRKVAAAAAEQERPYGLAEMPLESQFHLAALGCNAYLQGTSEEAGCFDFGATCAGLGISADGLAFALYDHCARTSYEDAGNTFEKLCLDFDGEAFFLAWPTLLSQESHLLSR